MLPGRKYGPEDILRIAWYRKWLLLAGIVLFAGITTAVTLRIPDQYKSDTLILVIPQRVPETYVHSTITTRIEERLRSIKQEILSRTRLEPIIVEFDLYPNLRKTRPMEQVIEHMRTYVDVDTVRDDAFTVSFAADTPRAAMIVADRLATMFIAENMRDRSVLADSTNQFLESQLEDARRRLITHERKLEEFRRRYAGELPSQLQTNLQVIQGAQIQIQNLNESINRDRDRRLLLEKAVADAHASDGTGAALADVAQSGGATLDEGRTADQLERARSDLHGLELRLKPGHPDVVAKKRLVAELERKLHRETASTEQPGAKPAATTADLIRQSRTRQVQVEIDKVDRQIAAKEGEVERLRQSVVDHQRRVEAVPGHESELTDLMRDYDTLQKIYSSLLAKKEDSKISANLERQQVSEQFKILDPARLPEKPFSPNRARIAALAAVVGLMFGAAFAAFLEYRDTGLRTEEEILRTLVLPVLAAIPMMNSVSERRRRRQIRFASAGALALIAMALVAAVLWRFAGLKGLP